MINFFKVPVCRFLFEDLRPSGSVVLFLALVLGCSRASEYVKPVVKQLREAVYASGYVVSENEYQVFAQVDGYITVLINEGEPVRSGSPICIIESSQQTARYKIALETYQLALKNSRDDSPALVDARAVVAATHTRHQFDSANFQRFKNLLASNATTLNEYERARLAAENSHEELQMQRSRLRQLQDQLKLNLINSENNLRIASEESDRYSVRSELNGRVYKMMKEDGELVRRGEVIAVVGGAAFNLRLSIDEIDIGRVTKGQPVMVQIDAFPGRTFTAHVEKIFPLVNERDQTVRVDADFSEPFDNGISGLAAEANIIIHEKEKAIVIPKSCLLHGDTVVLKDGNKTKKVKVVRGIETLDEVEVLEGLTPESMIARKP